MNRNKILILVGVVIVVIALLASFILLFRQEKTQQDNTPQSQSTVSLTPDDLKQITTFAPFFVEIYNSYGDGFLQPAINETTYATLEFQLETLAKFEQIDNQMLEGYFQETVVDRSTLQVSGLDSRTANVSMDAKVAVSIGEKTSYYPIRVELVMVLRNNTWLVSELEIIEIK